MKKQFWLNLPVKDVNRSREFFDKIGFQFNPDYEKNDNSACLLLGDQRVVVMLFQEKTFRGFTGRELSDSRNHSEVLLSVDAASKQEVDDLVNRAVEAGGNSAHKPYEMQGPLYGAVFSDPDGHMWNVLYMDIPKK